MESESTQRSAPVDISPKAAYFAMATKIKAVLHCELNKGFAGRRMSRAKLDNLKTASEILLNTFRTENLIGVIDDPDWTKLLSEM